MAKSAAENFKGRGIDPPSAADRLFSNRFDRHRLQPR
jgi:hypothetical protein